VRVAELRILGFFSPVPSSKWKKGKAVPIKIALADGNGTRIPDAEAQSLVSGTCRVTFSATGAQTANACMKYDTIANQFVFNWKLAGSGIGLATIKVTVTYPPTAPTTVLSETITVTG
jgi:hypothetical protein